MNSKRSALLFTGLIVTAILIALNYLVGGVGVGNLRFDLTEKKLYTLADGTKHILANIKPDEPVTIRFYATRDNRLMPPIYTKYAATVEDLLLELEKASDHKVTVQLIDPRPDTDAEDKARGDDIAGHVVNENEDKVYFGLAVECRDHKEVIANLNPGEETTLEYDLARAITKVLKVKKSIVGVMSALPIIGPAMNFPMMRQQQPQPWGVIEQLRQDYEVKEVPMTTDKIDADIGILVIIHPADIQQKAEFAIDQFVLRGGKVVAFVDPQCAVSAIYNQQQNPMMGMQPPTMNPSSSMKALFKAWGIGYDPQMVVADMTDATGFQNRVLPTFLTISPKDDGINRSIPATSQLEAIQMFSPGAFTVEKKEGINTTTLLQSSENSMMVDAATAEKARRTPLDSFRSEGRKRILGLQLSGHFKTAFPNGAPKDTGPPATPNQPGGMQGLPPGFPSGLIPQGGGTGGSEADAGAPAKADEKKDAPAPAPVTAAPVTATTPPVSAPPATTPPATAPKTPETKPADAPKPVEPAKADAAKTPAAEAKPATSGTPATPATAAGPSSLKESQNDEGAVFLFADADMLYDGFCFRQDQLGQMSLINHNMVLLLNIVEMLNGGADLITVRSRGSTKREFSKFKELRNAVEDQYRPQLQQLSQERDEAERKVAETMSQMKTVEVKLDKGVPKILDPKLEATVNELKAKSADAAKKIRELRKEENKGRDWQELWITLVNLLAVPLLVIIFGIALAVKRHTLQAAK